MADPKNTAIITACGVAIVASAGWIYLSQFRNRDVAHRALTTVGEMMADETTRRLGGNGQVVVITTDSGFAPAADTEAAVFRKALARHSRITVAATETVGPADQLHKGLQLGFSADRFLEILRAHAGVDAVVSFAGAAPLSAQQIAQLPRARPKIFVVCRARTILPSLLEQNVVQVAIVPRFQFPAPVGEHLRTEREWFDRYFQLVTDPTTLRMAR